jgi:hypothetical protein
MKKNDVFTFTAPNGAEVTGIVVDVIKDDRDWKWYLCYAQNRLFHFQVIAELHNPVITVSVDFCIIPECDSLLKDYYHQLDMADDYASREV